MFWGLVLQICLIVLHKFLQVASGLEYGISTLPSDLGFEKYVESSSDIRSIFFIQPTKSGFIEANIGGVESKHDYNMSSISVYLSSHAVTLQGNYISEEYALCSVENAHLVAKNNAMLLCHFEVSMPSYNGYIFSTSSCLIHCAKESECAAKIDLEFLIRQAQVSVPDRAELIISYNVTALDVNSRGSFVERDDVTNSLIYKNMKLPPVIVHRRSDTEFATLLTNEHNFPSIQLEVPRISDPKHFDLVILQTSSTNLWKMKLNFVFSSQLRFLWAKEVEGGPWKLQGTPSPRGLTVKLRQRSISSQLNVASDDQSNDFRSPSLDDNILERRTATQIGLMRFERVTTKSSRTGQAVVVPGTGGTESFTHLPTSDTSAMVGNEEFDFLTDDEDEPEAIKIRVVSIEWPKGLASNSTAVPDAAGRLVRLPIPTTPPDPNSMHIFVLFQPADILEPPWSPSREPPPPRQLKVLGVVPLRSPSSTRAAASSFRSFYEDSVTPSSGRLIHLTNKIYCRSDSQNTMGPLAATLPMLHQQQSTCPFQMREAPVELELNPPLGANTNGGKIVLGLQDTAGGLPVYADSLHAPPPPRNGIPWSWRAWIGPTVRRWHFENFNIRLQSDRLRKISNFPVFDSTTNSCTPRYEQTKITITARIFTTLPNTGERMYLSDVLPGSMEIDDISTRDYSHLSHRPVELDVTHLIPFWSLRLRVFPSASAFPASSSKTPAVIFRNKRSVYPFLIGQNEGHVRVELIAAPKDSQPLAFKDVSVVSSEKNDLAQLKFECISWLITLSGRLEPHPSANILLRSTTDAYGTAILDDETSTVLLLPNEKEMVADFASHPHPRVLNLIVRGHDPTDLDVVTSQLYSGTLQNLSASSRSFFCPIGKISLSLLLEDGTEMGLHSLPEGQVRISSLLQKTQKSVVWDPAKPLIVAPTTEEGKALVAGGKIGLGPMVDGKSVSLWAGDPVCSPKTSLFLSETRPIISISAGPLTDPGPPEQEYSWEQEAIEDYRRITGSTLSSSFDFGRSHFLVPRDSYVPDLHNRSMVQDTSQLFSTPMKYALLGVIIFSAIFLTTGVLALIIIRHRKALRRKKERIEEGPNGPNSGECGKMGDVLYPISPQLSTATGATAATMNPGLSCSSVFSGGSGGACTPAQTAELINQWTGRQQHSSLCQGQPCSSCSNSVATRSPQSDAMHNDLRASGIVDMRCQVNNHTLKLDSSQSGGIMSPSSPNFSSKWRAPESLGSAPSSRNTGSPSTNDEGFASGPLELQSKRHFYRGNSPKLDNTSWGGAGMNAALQASCSCQAGSPHPSQHLSDPSGGNNCNSNCYISSGAYMGTSIGTDSGRFYGALSPMQQESMPPRLTLAHDPDSIGAGKYMSKLNQIPPLMLPAALLKMETSQTAGAGFIGDTEGEKIRLDSGRESQDKTSSSGASSGMNKDFSSMSGIEITQVDV